MQQIRDDLDHIKQRRLAKFSAWKCWPAGRRQEKIERAQQHIADEFDIVNFLRNQMLTQIHRKLVFNPLDRYLLKNQAKPFVLNSKAQCQSDTDSDDYRVEKMVVDR